VKIGKTKRGSEWIKSRIGAEILCKLLGFGEFELAIGTSWHNRAMLVITRHRVAQIALPTWLLEAKASLAPLATQPGCISAEIGLATDEPDLVSVVTRWEDVGAYRRALSNFEVKMQSIPFLSTAVDESTAFELIHRNMQGEQTDFSPARAFDADEIGLGYAASENVKDRLGN
jgi:hypothetical protein